MSTPHFKIVNKTAVPFNVALFMEPRLDNFPSHSTTLAPGAKVEWSPTLASYQICAMMAGDDHAHNEWSWNFPGVAAMVAPLELGFKAWHDGDLDWADIQAMNNDDMENVFGQQYTFAQKGGCGWGGTKTVDYQIFGGPAWVDETGEGKLWRPGHAVEVVCSNPLSISKS